MRRIPAILVLAAASAVLGCQDEPIMAPDTVTAPHSNALSAASRSTAPVVTFADPEGEPVGTSQIVRNGAGVSVRLSTTGLEPRTAATLWIVIFNEPENCTAPACGEDDLFRAEPVVDVMYAAGSVVGPGGDATFAGRRTAGDGRGSLWAALGLPSPGLIDARTAEIHLIVRSHGPLVRGLVGDMIRTFNGGCDDAGLPDDPLIGPAGPNACTDVQFAVHAP